MERIQGLSGTKDEEVLIAAANIILILFSFSVFISYYWTICAAAQQ